MAERIHIIDDVRLAFERPITAEGDRASDLYLRIIDKVTSPQSMAFLSAGLARNITELNGLADKLGSWLMLEGQFANYHNAASQINHIIATDPAGSDVPPVAYLV